MFYFALQHSIAGMSFVETFYFATNFYEAQNIHEILLRAK